MTDLPLSSVRQPGTQLGSPAAFWQLFFVYGFLAKRAADTTSPSAISSCADLKFPQDQDQWVSLLIANDTVITVQQGVLLKE
jgi:hypothetical protein